MKPCACGTPQPPHVCAWKLKAEFLIPAGQVVKGDLIQVGIGFMPVTGVYTNPEQRKSKKGTVDHQVITIYSALSPKEVKLTTPVQVRRVGLCEAACCDRCAREVGEGKFICRAHWDAWEQRDALDQTLEAYCG